MKAANKQNARTKIKPKRSFLMGTVDTRGVIHYPLFFRRDLASHADIILGIQRLKKENEFLRKVSSCVLGLNLNFMARIVKNIKYQRDELEMGAAI